MKAVKQLSECTEQERYVFENLLREHLRVFPSYKPINREDFLMVMTPNPYIILAENKSNDLEKHVEEFYDILRRLKISKKKAQEEDYTLNHSTGERLSHLVVFDRKNRFTKEQKAKVRSFNW